MDPTDRRKKLLSLLTWVNSLETDHKISDLSQLSNGSVLAQCLRLLGFLPDISINQSPLEFVLSTLSDFYGCDLAKCGVLQLSGIQAGKEEEIARVLVLLLCMAVKHSENENFIEAILTFPNDVKFDLKYFIETTMEQIDSGGLTSGDFVLGFDGTHSTNSTPMCNSWSSSKPCYSFASPALQKWLCSPSVSEEVTPKISNNQLFESLEVKELKHQLKLIKKELEMQRSLVTDMEGENELLSEKYSNLTVSAAEKDEKIRQLQDKCEELEHLENVDIKLQKAEDEIKNLRQQLEFAKEESNARSELQQKITGQHKELKELYQKKNLFEVKLLTYQHQVQELELECKNQQSQSTRSLKRCNEALERIEVLEKQNSDLQDELTKEREALETTSTSLRQQNCTLNTELTLLQEQYVCIMSTVGNQGQENERLQHSLNDMEDKLDAKEQHKKLLEEQVALLTTQVEKGLRDSELHIKEFDHKEAKMRKEWEERISIQEAKSSVELSRAKEMVKSCQLSIRNLTREKDEAKLSATQQLHNLEATYKEQVKALQQEISDCKELSEQQLLWLKKHISEQELQLKETKECLQQKIEQAEQYRKTIILLEQKSNSAEFDQCEAERRHQDELRLYADELDKVNCEHGIEVLELTQQLQEVNGKYRMLVRANEELRKECTDIQSVFNKQEQDCTKSLQQCEKLNEKKDTLMLDIKQNQVVAEQQIQIIAKGLEQLRNEAKSTAKHSVIEQKKDLGEVSSFKQQNKMPLQKDVRLTGQLKQYQETDTALKQKLTFSLAEEDNNSGRFEELKARNSFHPPHLKSCYPVELQLNCGTPRSSEFQFKSADVKASGYLEFSPPHKRGMAHHQSDSPHYAKRRVSAPPTPTLQASKMHLRSYLKEERENKPPPLAFEISLDEQSRTAMDKRKSKMFQRMTATRKTKHEEQKFTATVTKPLRTRNASKKK